MTKHDTPGEVPLIEREKGELVEIIGRLKDNLAWYVEERKRLIEERDALRYTFNPNAEVVDRWKGRAEHAESSLAEARAKALDEAAELCDQLHTVHRAVDGREPRCGDAIRNLRGGGR